MADILLTTLNARYSHTALGLRYLRANLGPLRERSRIREFTIAQRPADVAEKLLADSPKVIGIGVYIWNIEQSTELVAILKRAAPEVTVVIGGPEVSHEYQQMPIVAEADYLIRGAADHDFARLCQALDNNQPPAEKVIEAAPVDLDTLVLPYDEYSDEDITHRTLYVEASRGCPFKCEFCLSALDRTAWPFPLEPLLEQLDSLYRRGARRFKFVDRTFNLKVERSAAILDFFLQRLDSDLFLHFELIPDHLPEALKERIGRFPPGSLQFEIGVQSLDPQVQQRISRRQDSERSEANIRWLREHSHAHLHVDLIVGLPGEGLEQLGQGFDRLIAMNPHEIQVGILKRLRGAPIARHDAILHYSPHAPYNIVRSDVLGFAEIQRLGRFARYWDLVANSGRFKQTLPLLLGDSPFDRFLTFSDWLWQTGGQTHRIQLRRLFTLHYHGLTGPLGVNAETAQEVLRADYTESGLKGEPDFELSDNDDNRATGGRTRQLRHIEK